MESVEAFYWLPHCTTCQKADSFLKDNGVHIDRYIDVKSQTVPLETLKKLAAGVGGVENLFSKRALKYRAMGLNTRQLSDEEMLDLMHQEYTFIKRPVVVTKSGKTVSGFSKKQFETLVV